MPYRHAYMHMYIHTYIHTHTFVNIKFVYIKNSLACCNYTPSSSLCLLLAQSLFNFFHLSCNAMILSHIALLAWSASDFKFSPFWHMVWKCGQHPSISLSTTWRFCFKLLTTLSATVYISWYIANVHTLHICMYVT